MVTRDGRYSDLRSFLHFFPEETRMKKITGPFPASSKQNFLNSTKCIAKLIMTVRLEGWENSENYGWKRQNMMKMTRIDGENLMAASKMNYDIMNRK